MEIKFEYKLEDADFRAAARSLGKKRRLSAWIYTLVMAVVLIALYLLPSDPGTSFIAGAIVSSFGMSLCAIMSLTYQTAKNYKSIPSMHEINLLAVTDEGIAQTATSWKTDFQWSHFQSSVETTEHFFLLSGVYPALWFPKRVMSREIQEELRKMLQKRVPASTKK